MSYYYYGVVLFYISFRWSGIQYPYIIVYVYVHRTITDAYGGGTAMVVPLTKMTGPLGNSPSSSLVSSSRYGSSSYFHSSSPP